MSSPKTSAAGAEVRRRAIALLKSPEVRVAVQARRERYQAAVNRFAKSDLDTILAPHVTLAETELIPAARSICDPPRLPVGATDRMARLWIAQFLDEAASTEAPFPSLVRKYARLLVAEATRHTVCLRYVVPLFNFESTTPFELKGTINGRRYRCSFIRNLYPMDPARHGFFVFPEEHDPYGLRSVSSVQAKLCSWVLLIDVVFPEDGSGIGRGNSVEQINLHRLLMRTLRLFHDGAVDGPIQFASSDSAMCGMGGRAMFSSFDQVRPGDKYQFADADLREFRAFWRVMEKHFPSTGLPPRLSLSIDYFESSYTKYGPHQFLDLSIALESLFDIAFEQTYRLPLRVAAFLEDASEGVTTTYEAVRDLWKIRNKIAHGSPELLKAKMIRQISEGVPKLRKLVRRSIVRHMDLFRREGSAAAYERVIHKDFEQRFVLSRLKRLGARQLGET